MSETNTLVTGLGGAIGSDYHRERNRLYFVEYDGAVSRADLIRDEAAIVSSGSDVIHGTYTFDLDAGVEGDEDEADIWWQQETDVERQMTPWGDAEITNLGVVNYGGLSSAELQRFDYGDEPINGDDDDTNELVEGDVFAVVTNQGNYAKVEVTDYGYDLGIEWTTYELRSPYRVLGTGYDRPEDIVLARNGERAYVTERGGSLLAVDLDDADRSEATVVASGLTAPHQLVLDEPRSEAYLVEFADPGRLVRVDLTTGAVTTLYDGLRSAVGLALTGDRTVAYVTEQEGGHAGDGRLSRVTLGSGHRESVVDRLEAPFFLTWAGPAEERLLFTERDPNNRVVAVDLPTYEVRDVVSDVPFRPSSVTVVGPGRLAVCSDDVVSLVDLPGATFAASGPYVLGVGRIPETYITQGHTDPDENGYADTTGGDHDFVVDDAPFGGTLPLKINHERAFEEGYRYYRLLVDGDEPRQTWTDHKWSTSTREFEHETISPMSGGYYRVREPDELWYNPWLGYELNTRGLSNGLHTITVEFYSRRSRSSASVSDSKEVRIDNQEPRASIDRIIQQHDTDGPTPVGTCAIVEEGGDEFTFEITADDPQGHLLRYDLDALWGDNERKDVHRDTYAENKSNAPHWHGLTAAEVPPTDSWSACVPGDLTSIQCAHTFVLRVWDRTINGRHRIHRSQYHQSITIMLPESECPSGTS